MGKNWENCNRKTIKMLKTLVINPMLLDYNLRYHHSVFIEINIDINVKNNKNFLHKRKNKQTECSRS